YIAEYQCLQARTNLSESSYYQMVRYINGLRKDIKERVEMYTMNTISDAITLAYKAEKQIQASSRISYQRPSRSYSTPLSLEPKHEPQTPHPCSHLTFQKEPPGTFTSPVNKPNFIPIRNNPRKPNSQSLCQTPSNSLLQIRHTWASI